MAVDYLRDYLGIDPADYSAMERTIAGVSPVGQSIIPTMGATPTVQPRIIDDTPIAFTPRPMQDFGAQISGLEEQINNLMEQMGVLEAEKNDALQQQDVMRAELAQAQQDALTEQASEFEGVKSSLEQQIADLTAQIGSMQEPTIMKDAPVPPRDEQIFVPPKTIADIDAPRDVVTTRAQPQLQKLPLRPKRADFMSIDRLPALRKLTDEEVAQISPLELQKIRQKTQGTGSPKNIFEKINQQIKNVNQGRGPQSGTMLPSMPRSPSIPPMTPPMTPMPMPMPEPVMPIMPMPQPMIPIEPQPMSMAGGQMNMMFDNMRPTMMRAGGGGISKAIVDLESKLR